MNNGLLGFILVSIMILAGCSEKLDTDQKKVSYAIGQQIGQNLKSQKVDFDPEVLAASIKDASASKPSKLTQAEIQDAIKKMQANMSKKQAEAAQANLEKAKKFMEENKKNPEVKTTASGLQYIVVSEGTGKTPGPTDIVKTNYKGTLTDGQPFDSSYTRGQPAQFPVGQVIKGWTEALQMMKVGGKVKLFVPPELGYGSSQRPNIPANSVLVFEMELVDTQPAPAKQATAPPLGPKVGQRPIAKPKNASTK